MCNARPPMVRDNKGEHKTSHKDSKATIRSKMKISLWGDGKRLESFHEIQTSVRKEECR